MRRFAIALVAVGASATACSRSFDPPPPVPAITQVDPAAGYRGDWVWVQGTNFDPNPESNLVFIATANAEVLQAGPEGLRVEVPDLGPDPADAFVPLQFRDVVRQDEAGVANLAQRLHHPIHVHVSVVG